MIEKFLNDILSHLGVGSKEFVYLSITPGVGLELIQIDPAIKAVKAYGHKPLVYNDSMREVASYTSFKDALSELFSELNINPKCNVVLNLPIVHFGKINLPLLLNDEGVTEAIVSEVEQAYIFKRCEPVVSWFESNGNSAADTRTIFYSAVQKQAVDSIKEVLTGMGATLSRVEVSMISSLRALLFSGLTETQMTGGASWNLMIISSNGYSVVSMLGKSIVDYTEEPLALKTYELDEIYDAINSSAQIALMGAPSNYLFIVSETDLVSAEHLAGKLQFEGKIDFLDDNRFKKNEILPVSLNILPDEIVKISLEAIGIAALKYCNYPITLEFSGNVIQESSSGEEYITFHFDGKEIVLTESILKKISLAIAGILIIPSLAALLFFPMLKKSEQAKLDEIKTKASALDAQIQELTNQASESGAFVVKSEIEKVLKNNRAKLIAYSAIGESVPKNLWITYFSAKGEGKMVIKGASNEVEDIYVFFKNMKDSLIDPQLRLYKLEMQSSSLDDAVTSLYPSVYDFEITNMTEAEINPPPVAAADPNAAPEQTERTSPSGMGMNNMPMPGPNASPRMPNLPNNKKNVNQLEPIEP